MSDELANDISQRVLSGRKTIETLEETLLDKVIVHEKTLRQWTNALFVKIEINSFDDDDTNMKKLANYAAEVGKNIQIAEHLLGIFEMQASAANNFKDKQFATRYVEELNNTEGRKIAAEKIRYLVLANSDIDNNEMASQSAAVIRDFFKRVVKGLEEARKSIENQIALNKQRIWLSHKG